MALSVGDAVLTFLGDTTQLDQAFNKVATEAGAKMGVASGHVEGLTKSMAVGQQGAVELGTTMNLAGEEVKESMYEARGSLGLFNDVSREVFGVNVPRHVRSFIAELPGVGTALSSAFQATAVLFLVAAFVEVMKKLAEFSEHWENVRQAEEKAALQLENLTIKEGDHTKSLELSNLKLDDQIAKLENRPSSNKLSEALLETSIAADNLAARFSKDFEKMTDEIISTTGFTGQFSQAISEMARSSGGIGGNIGAVLTGGIAAAATGIIVVRDALKQVSEQMLEINKLRIEQAGAKTEEQQVAATRALAEAYGVLAQTSKNALGLVQLDAPTNLKLITELSSVIIQATAAQRDFGLQTEAVHKRVRLAVDESAKEQADALKKKDQEVIKSINERLTEEQKLYKKETDAALKSVEEELAARKKAEIEELQLAHQRLDGQIALIDGELHIREQVADHDAIILKTQYDKREISAREYLTKLKALSEQEIQDLTQMLNRKQQLVIQEAINESAQRGRIITADDAKQLKSYIDLENKKSQITAEFNNKYLKSEDQITAKIVKEHQTLGKLLDDYGKKLKAAERDLHGFGQVANSVLGDVSTAFGSAIEAWLSGQESFGKALEKALGQYLIQVAGKAAIDALYFTAWGIADSFWNPARAGADFAAAAEFAAIAGAAGAAGAALSKAGKGSSGDTGTHPQVDSGNPNTQPAPPGQGGKNVPHLAGGGLITAPTLAMIHSQEAVIPLADSGVMDAIGEAIARHSAGGEAGNNFYVRGMVSADTLGKIAKKLSRQVQTGRARLVASNSHKLTRRA